MDHDRDVVRVRNAAAVRLNVASSNAHVGDTICQIILLKSFVYWVYPSLPRSVAK
jgi:hypothetical protein